MNKSFVQRPTFPDFPVHEEALCFNCHGRLGETPVASGYPHGGGQWEQKCLRCEMTTFYDVEPSEPQEASVMTKISDIVRGRPWGKR